MSDSESKVAAECDSQSHIIAVTTSCDVWSLNMESIEKKRFWWNALYSISVWEDVLNINKPTREICDDDVWSHYIAQQLSNIFKVCPICTGEEGKIDMGICCYCSSTVHVECSSSASVSQIAWKSANAPFREKMRVCFRCDDITYDQAELLSRTQTSPDLERACSRVLSIQAELPPTIMAEINKIAAMQVTRQWRPSVVLQSLRAAVTPFFSP